jgi:hypothetical protein
MALRRVKDHFWKWLGPPPEVPKVQIAPIGIDRFSHLPLHYDPPECPICKFDEWQCHDCGGSIIDRENSPFGVGMESITVTHMHIHPQHGWTDRTIRVPARRKLCLPCFRLDWAKAHPDKPCDL